MTKRIILTIIGLVILIGILGGVKTLQIGRMMAQGNFTPPPEPVTTAKVRAQDWDTLLSAVGSLVAVQGVTVTAELNGKVVRIAFEPGTPVKAGDLLVRQDTSSEEAQLRANEATVALARINLQRNKRLIANKTVSQSQYDDAVAQFNQAVAQSDNIATAIAKKNIRAPFSGRLGIRQVNLGQVLNEGDPIVSLQALDPIFVNFLLPQQQLARIRTGLTVRVTTDALPGRVIEGAITAINPEVDSATRNIRVQATLANADEQLRPGMYVTVAVVLPAKQKFMVIPATAVLYAPYSDSVFVVEEKKDEQSGNVALFLRQQFVRLGEKRGDFVSVTEGLQGSETVVSTGIFKLRNQQAVVVDNKLAPEFKLAPQPENE